MNILEAAKESEISHASICPGEAEICLGELSDFDMSAVFEADVFGHMGKLYHFIRCPRDIHELVVHMAMNAILNPLSDAFGTKLIKVISPQKFADKTLQTALYQMHESISHRASKSVEDPLKESLPVPLQRVVLPEGSADFLIQNQIGCHSWQRKQPDSQFNIHWKYKGTQKYPLIVIEVASKHEDLHKLLCEGSAWLNVQSDCIYAILIKLWAEEERIEIFVLEKMPEDMIVKPSVGCSDLTEEELRSFRDSKLEEIYQFKIIFHQSFTKQPDQPVEAQLDVDKLFQNTTFDPEDLPAELVINFDVVLEVFFDKLASMKSQ